MGEGFTWETQDKERDIAAATAAWEKAKELIVQDGMHMVLLDEINIALRYGYIDEAEVIDFLTTQKPEMTHVVLTGRNASEALIEVADLVTEMTLITSFRSGVKAQIGVEFDMTAAFMVQGAGSNVGSVACGGAVPCLCPSWADRAAVQAAEHVKQCGGDY